MTKEVLQQTQKSEKIKGIEVLPKEGIPLLVVSNHCFSLKFLPLVKRFMKYRSDTSMVANAGFTPFLGMLGIDSIGVNSLEHKPSGNLIKDSWGRIIRLSGNLVQERQKSSDKSRRILEETVIALAATAERRDPYTAGHQRRVAQLACRIAKEMNLTEDQIEVVHEKIGSLKVGHYLPGTRIPIVSDQPLYDLEDKSKPILNLAWHISKEIQSYLKSHDYTGEIIDIINADDF